MIGIFFELEAEALDAGQWHGAEGDSLPYAGLLIQVGKLRMPAAGWRLSVNRDWSDLCCDSVGLSFF